MGAARLLLMNMYSEEGFLLSASRKELIKAFVLRRKGDETIQVAPTKSLFWNLAIIHLCSREKCARRFQPNLASGSSSTHIARNFLCVFSLYTSRQGPRQSRHRFIFLLCRVKVLPN
jgi:hypothetical protein